MRCTSCFRPLIRGFFFYVGNVPSLVMAHQRVSVPSFGDSFFMVKKNESNDRRKRRFPSPHSGILFLYIMKISSIIGKLFPSPHSGILFLFENMKSAQSGKSVVGFRPLIRGFFFYPFKLEYDTFNPYSVSVPSFGDSFFIGQPPGRRCGSG